MTNSDVVKFDVLMQHGRRGSNSTRWFGVVSGSNPPEYHSVKVENSLNVAVGLSLAVPKGDLEQIGVIEDIAKYTSGGVSPKKSKPVSKAKVYSKPTFANPFVDPPSAEAVFVEQPSVEGVFVAPLAVSPSIDLPVDDVPTLASTSVAEKVSESISLSSKDLDLEMV